MKQLLLDINAEISPSLETFVVGRHPEIVQLLHLFAQRISTGERTVYLWGEAGAGKSHLLRALANMPAARYLDASDASTLVDEMEYSSETSLYLLDNCQNLSDAQQVAAFNLFNQIKENHAFLVASGSLPPAMLMLREDLRTRLGWGLIYQLHGLTDKEKMAALNVAACARGIPIPDHVLSYLITHYQRDMPSLSRTVDALINFSLEAKRPITLPLLRELIQSYEQSHQRYE